MEKKRILLIDDAEDIRSLATAILVRQGFTVDCVSSGPEGIQFLKETPGIDLVLLDVVMPGMGGFETLEKINQQFERNSFQVCFLSGKRNKEDILTGIRLGATDYIVKPLRAGDLTSKIVNIFTDNKKFDIGQFINVEFLGTLANSPMEVTFKLTGICADGIEFESPHEFKVNYQANILCQELSEILGLDSSIQLRVLSSQVEGNISKICASFVGLTEEQRSRILSHTSAKAA